MKQEYFIVGGKQRVAEFLSQESVSSSSNPSAKSSVWHLKYDILSLLLHVLLSFPDKKLV